MIDEGYFRCSHVIIMILSQALKKDFVSSIKKKDFDSGIKKKEMALQINVTNCPLRERLLVCHAK